MLGIIGTGGHAKVIMDICKRAGQTDDLIFFTSTPLKSVDKAFQAYRIYEAHSHTLQSFQTVIKNWHVAIGNLGIRKEKVEWLLQLKAHLAQAIHDRSVLAHSCSIGEGTSIMAGAVINCDAKVGKACIINTTASVDHDCHISDYVNIGPGCKLAGGVVIGEETELGTGAIVIPNKKIGKKCVIGAGAVVIDDVPDFTMVAGVPAKFIRSLRGS